MISRNAIHHNSGAFILNCSEEYRMIRLTKSILLAFAVFGASCSAVDAFKGHRELLSNFGGQFRCPYAKEWLTKGPEQAAADLGLLTQDLTAHGHQQEESPPQQHHVRRKTEEQEQQEEQQDLRGSCEYINAFTGTPACLEMRGTGWTPESLAARCDSENGSLALDRACPVPEALAGICIVENNGDSAAIEATSFDFSMGGCSAAKNACETFVSGSFVGSESCSADSSTPEAGESSGGDDLAQVFCEIAPGPIGAAHQAGYASGYFSNCPGTPAESSPYQWPTAWTADVDSQSMSFGSDAVVYHSIGSVYYRLDKNWKRADTAYTRGIQRGLGQGPCEPENMIQDDPGAAGIPACRRDSDQRLTMLHRGSKMYFITWKNGTAANDDNVTNIEDCGWLDLQVVGNVRPDWYMDNVGADTDVQYLGDQHVYHEGIPRLVKQWRKKDFASQYFTMSMLANTDVSDDIHWPIVLNVPGEGFGDDFLSSYTNHRLLTDEDDGLFLLDEAFVASGGSCPQMSMGGEGPAGPPAIDEENKIPSNLEVDPNAWYSNVYTFSPVWKPPLRQSCDGISTPTDGQNLATTTAGSLTTTSCFDEESKHVQLTFVFNEVDYQDETELPWLAIGYRPDEVCAMNKGGMDTDIILIAADPLSGEATAAKGLLPAVARSSQSGALASVYSSLSSLETSQGYSNVTLLSPFSFDVVSQTRSFGLEGIDTDSVVLRFHQSMDVAPEVMHLMYAIGTGPQLGYHATRLCFEVTEFPKCAGVPSSSTQETEDEDKTAPTGGSGASKAFHPSIMAIVTMLVAASSVFVVF